MKAQREAGIKLAYSIEEAAAASSLSTDTIRRAIRAGKLKARRSGVSKDGAPAGKHLILHGDLVSWLEGLGAA